MARSFLRSSDNFFHRSIRPSESDIICNRVFEKINPLEYETEVLHKGIKAVISYIPSAKRNLAFLDIPESGNKWCDRSLTAAGRADYSSRCILFDIESYIIDYLSVLISKAYILKTDVSVSGLDILTVNVHLRKIRDLICKINTLSDDLQKCCVYTCRIEWFKDHERAHEHCDRIHKIHGTRHIEPDRSSSDNNTCELADKHLDSHSRNSCKLSSYVCLDLTVDSFGYTWSVKRNDIVVADLCNALDIFKNYSDDILVRFELLSCNLCDLIICHLVTKEENSNSYNGDQTDPPVKEKHADTDYHSRNASLKNHHYRSCCDISYLLHRICSNRCDMAKARIVEISHREISKVLCNLDPLLCASVVTGFRLEHMTESVDSHLTNCA